MQVLRPRPSPPEQGVPADGVVTHVRGFPETPTSENCWGSAERNRFWTNKLAMQMEDGSQTVDENKLFLGYGLQRFARDQQRRQMSVVAETQLLRLAKVQDMHLFAREPRGQCLCLNVAGQLPELFLGLGVCFTGASKKAKKTDYASENAVDKRSQNLDFPS